MSNPKTVIWFTGLSGSGKSTIAKLVASLLKERGLHTEELDGDRLRASKTAHLSFTPEDRSKNIEMAGKLAHELSEKGSIVVASFISPFRVDREKLKKSIPGFIEVYVNAPLSVCESRDAKGLYAKARKGELTDFTGVHQAYEAPTAPDLELHTDIDTPQESGERVLHFLGQKHII